MVKKKHGWKGNYIWNKDSRWSKNAWNHDTINGLAFGRNGHILSLVAGTAFFAITGPSLVGYIGVEGTSTPWKINVRDKEGNLTTGFVGAAGGGEALGSELLSNIGFETAGAGGVDVWANWTEVAGDGALANETTNKHGGADAAKLTTGATANTQVYQNASVTAGTTYKLSFWMLGADGENGRALVYDATASVDVWALAVLSMNVYTQFTWYATAPSGCSSLRLTLACPTTATAFCFADDVSVKAFTDCAVTGVHIISAKDGSTHNWTSIGAGFNYNAAGYRVELRRA